MKKTLNKLRKKFPNFVIKLQKRSKDDPLHREEYLLIVDAKQRAMKMFKQRPPYLVLEHTIKLICVSMIEALEKESGL